MLDCEEHQVLGAFQASECGICKCPESSHLKPVRGFQPYSPSGEEIVGLIAEMENLSCSLRSGHAGLHQARTNRQDSGHMSVGGVALIGHGESAHRILESWGRVA